MSSPDADTAPRRRRRWGRASLAGQFFAFQLVVVGVVLIAVGVASWTQSRASFRDVQGQRMIAVAETIASTPLVRDRHSDPFAASLLAADVNRGIALSGAALAEIISPDGVIRASSAPTRLGDRAEFGDSDVGEGRALVRRRRVRRCDEPRRAGPDPRRRRQHPRDRVRE